MTVFDHACAHTPPPEAIAQQRRLWEHLAELVEAQREAIISRDHDGLADISDRLHSGCRALQEYWPLVQPADATTRAPGQQTATSTDGAFEPMKPTQHLHMPAQHSPAQADDAALRMQPHDPSGGALVHTRTQAGGAARHAPPQEYSDATLLHTPVQRSQAQAGSETNDAALTDLAALQLQVRSAAQVNYELIADALACTDTMLQTLYPELSSPVYDQRGQLADRTGALSLNRSA